MNATQLLLKLIENPGVTRDGVADAYANCMAAGTAESVEWPIVNRAIISRWSKSGLLYIKKQAWKQASA